jgi:hypothetical protein
MCNSFGPSEALALFLMDARIWNSLVECFGIDLVNTSKKLENPEETAFSATLVKVH